MAQKKTKYEILAAGKWIACVKATEEANGWLHYQLSDGTNGLKRPTTWREIKKQKD